MDEITRIIKDIKYFMGELERVNNLLKETNDKTLKNALVDRMDTLFSNIQLNKNQLDKILYGEFIQTIIAFPQFHQEIKKARFTENYSAHPSKGIVMNLKLQDVSPTIDQLIKQQMEEYTKAYAVKFFESDKPLIEELNSSSSIGDWYVTHMLENIGIKSKKVVYHLNEKVWVRISSTRSARGEIIMTYKPYPTYHENHYVVRLYNNEVVYTRVNARGALEVLGK